MNKLIKILFGSKKQEILFDEKFLDGKLTTEQLYNLDILFSAIPEKLIVGNKDHLKNAWTIVKYYSELVQYPMSFNISSLSKLKYPRSSIKCSLLFIRDDIQKNNMLNFDIYMLRREVEKINELKSSLFVLSLQLYNSYVDLDEFIDSWGKNSNKKHDESLELFKKIVSN